MPTRTIMGGNVADGGASSGSWGSTLDKNKRAQSAYEPTGTFGQAMSGQRPADLEWNSLLDPSTGLLKDQYQMQTTALAPEMQQRLDGIQMDSRGLDKFRDFALGTGDSEFAQKMLEKQKLDQQSALENATNNAASQAAQARTAMAMKGGLSSGAAERLSRNSMLDAYNQKQQINRQGMSDRLGIQAQDAQSRQQALSQLPGMEINAMAPELQKATMWGNMATGDRTADMGAQQFNLGGAMGDVQNQRNFDLGQWSKKMEVWAGNKQADAQLKASEGSCWIISALSRFVKLPADQPELLTQFKHHMLKKDIEATKFYIRRCGKLIEKMDLAGFDWPSFKWFNDALVSMLRNGEIDAAYSLFRSTLCDLITTYWPECPYKTFAKMKQERSEKVALMQVTPELDLMPAELPLADRCLTNLGADCFVPAT